MTDDYVQYPTPNRDDSVRMSIKIGDNNPPKSPLSAAATAVWATLAILAGFGTLGLVGVVIFMHLSGYLWWAVVGGVAAAFSAANQLK